MATVTNSNVTPNDFIMRIKTEEDGSQHWANHISHLNSTEQTKLFTGSHVLVHLGIQGHDGRYNFYNVYINQREDGKLHYACMIDDPKDHPLMAKEMVQKFESFLNRPLPTPTDGSICALSLLSAQPPGCEAIDKYTFTLSQTEKPAMHFLFGKDS